MMFERIGAVAAVALYAGMGLFLGGAVVVAIAGGDVGAWTRISVWFALTPAFVLGGGLPLAGAAMTFWRILTDTKYGDG